MELETWSFNIPASEQKKRKEFGEIVRQSRRNLGMDMNSLAARANISGELLLRIESGLVSPEISSIRDRLLYALEREVMIIA